MQLMLDDLDLSEDPRLAGEQMEWIDEWEWSPIEQVQDRSLAGRLIIQEGSKLLGMPITLSSNGGAWFRLGTIRTLQTMLTPLRVMLLKLPGGAEHYVTWNHAAGAPIVARPVHREVAPGPDALHELTLRLITVAPPPAPPPDPEPDPEP
ncbi:hypothetical protein [Ectopseudomonas hydrolytica]|uniref:hypothetical protein n=1 Tax=Ectopseudomonas hydrolytica TaxID=2493633 RepID=UPI00376F219E